MNTPGSADGIAQLWVDGTQTVNYTGQWRPTTDGGPGQPSFKATFTFVRIFVQHGVGEMFYDDFAVGNTQIGCGATIAPPNKPASPASLTLTRLLAPFFQQAFAAALMLLGLV
jgi:hypothetical protein